MNIAVLIPVIAIAATAAIILAWMSYRHERLKWEAEGRQDGGRALETDNVRLRETVAELQDRIAVLEQIATDPAERTAREIENLR
jgi:hypothetical protein